MKNRSACIALAFLFHGLTALNEATGKKESTHNPGESDELRGYPVCAVAFVSSFNIIKKICDRQK